MKFRRADKAVIEANDLAPLRVQLGWSENISKNDAVEVAKGFIQKRFTSTPEAGWYAVAPFMGGFMWEVQEGGPGKAYLPAVIEALSRDPGGKHWFPSADRAFQIMMRDGKPFGVLLPLHDSRVLIDSGLEPLMPAGRMARASRKGTATLITGSAMFGSGFAFLVGSMIFYGLAGTPAPAVKDVKLDQAPHAQWNRVSETPVNEIITKLEFSKSGWKVEKRTHVIKDDDSATKADGPAPKPVVTPPAPPPPVPPTGPVPPPVKPITPMPLPGMPVVNPPPPAPQPPVSPPGNGNAKPATTAPIQQNGPVTPQRSEDKPAQPEVKSTTAEVPKPAPVQPIQILPSKPDDKTAPKAPEVKPEPVIGAAKPADQKAESKPAEVKPSEVKTPDAKPNAAKPDDKKVEVPPPTTKPAEVKPTGNAETKESKPANAKDAADKQEKR